MLQLVKKYLATRNLHVLACAAILLALTGQAKAEFIANDFGLTNPFQTVTFEEYVFDGGTQITDQFAELGVTFSGAPLIYTLGYGQYPNVDDPMLSNFFGPNAFSSPDNSQFSIHFTKAQNAAAFALPTAGSLKSVEGYFTRFAALLDGTEIESAIFQTSNDQLNNFFGFSGIIFDEIRVHVYQGVEPPRFLTNALIDSIQMSPVPEPSTITMLAVAALIGGLAAWRQRRRM